MRKFNLIAWGIVLSVVLFACNQTPKTTEKETAINTEKILFGTGKTHNRTAF